MLPDIHAARRKRSEGSKLDFRYEPTLDIGASRFCIFWNICFPGFMLDRAAARHDGTMGQTSGSTSRTQVVAELNFVSSVARLPYSASIKVSTADGRGNRFALLVPKWHYPRSQDVLMHRAFFLEVQERTGDLRNPRTNAEHGIGNVQFSRPEP